MTAVPARVAGVRRDRAVRAARPRHRARWRRRRSPRPPSPGSTRSTPSAGPRPSPPWPTAPSRSAPVDVIVGPGNVYVAVAKREVAGVGRRALGLRRAVRDRGGGRRHHAADLRRHRRDRAGRARPRRPGLAHHLVARGRRRHRRRARRGWWPMAPRRAEIERNFAQGGYLALVDGPEAAMAVANLIAPEHLAAHDRRSRGAGPAGAPRRRGVLRAAGRRRRSATTSPGPATCCPPSARPASAAPSPSTTSSSRCTSSPLDRAGVRAASRRSSRRWPPPRASTPTPSRSACARAALEPAGRLVIRPRDDVALMEGYHSPQVDVGGAAQHQRVARRRRPAAWRRAYAEARRRPSTGTATPTAAPPTCARAIAGLHGVDPDAGVRGQRLQRGAADPAAHLRRRRAHGRGVGAHLRPARPHQPPHRHRRGRGRAGRRLLDRPRRGRAGCSPRRRPSVAFLCSPNNPTGMVDDEATVREVLDAGRRRRRPAGGRRGLRPVRALVGARPGRRRRAARGDPHLLQDVVDGRRPPRLPGRPGRGRGRARQGRAAVPPRRGQAARRPAGPRLRRRDGRPGGRAWSRSGAGSSPRLAELPRRACGPRAPTSSCSGPVHGRRRRGLAGARSTGRCSCATARRGPASRAACASRSAPPTRTTPSSPPSRRSSHDRPAPTRLRRRPAVARTTNETDIAIDLDLDGTGRVEVVDRPPVLRPHARPARPPRRASTCRCGPRATSRSTPTTPSRTSASPSARCSATRWATRPACAASPPTGCRSTRRWSTWPSTCRAARSSLRGRLPRREDPGRPAVRPAAGRGVLAGVRHVGRGHHPARHAGAGPQHPPHHRGHVQGRGPLAARRGARSRAAASRPPRARCDRLPTAPRRRPRLRHRQPALGPEGARSTSGPTPGSPPTRRSIRDAAGVVLPGVGRVRAVHGGAARHAASTSVALEAIDAGPPVPRHLRRHADALRGLRRGARRRRPRGAAPARVRLLPDGVKRPQMQWNVLEPPRRPRRRCSTGSAEPAVGLLRALLRGRGRPTTWSATCDYGGPGHRRRRARHRVGHAVPPREVGGRPACACSPTSSALAAAAVGRPPWAAPATSAEPGRDGPLSRPSTCATAAACASTRATTTARPSTATTRSPRPWPSPGRGRAVDPRGRPRRGPHRRARSTGRWSPRSPPRSTVPVQTGGGVRDEAAAEALFDAGVARVVLGTAALERPEPGAAPGRPACRWRSGSTPAAARWPCGAGSRARAATCSTWPAAFADAGVAALVVTEIGRDGTLEGPDLDGPGRGARRPPPST